MSFFGELDKLPPDKDDAFPKIYIGLAQPDHLALPHSGKQCYQNKIGIGVVELL